MDPKVSGIIVVLLTFRLVFYILQEDITRDSGGEKSLNHATEDVNKQFHSWKSLVMRESKTFYFVRDFHITAR